MYTLVPMHKMLEVTHVVTAFDEVRPAGYISQQFERSGYTVATIRRGETINAHVDLAELWDKTQKAIKLQQVIASAAQLGGGSDADK